ncbi:perlwapin-like [Protopterus annectens]|uniref:perlwapin-like n=1 Tax=Protopterus annectens TaxID=7888 RepID=UPI001CF9875B|nr:perlwapin-like [Protopterus annectens]
MKTTTAGLLLLILFLWDTALFGFVEASQQKSSAFKAGHCPRKLKVNPSKRGCLCDEDCPGADKCCVYDCGAVCVPPAFRKPGVCPSIKWGAGICAEYCSDDSDCPGKEKCCSNGCGHQCTAPHTVKLGRCPPPKGTLMCAEFCYHDGQCPGEEKCCKTTCGHACTKPC